MINFLASPEQFSAQVKLASVDRFSLYKIANHQLRQANSMHKVSSWLTNAISSGVIWVKNLYQKTVNAIHAVTKKFFLSTPVISHLTKFFRKVAYKRLLSAMYDSWLLGVKDKINKKKSKMFNGRYFRSAYVKSQGTFYSADPFYEEYLMGYDGEDENSLAARAKMVTDRDIGTRTISEVAKAAFDSLNIFNTLFQLIRDFADTEAYTGKNLQRGTGPRVRITKSNYTSDVARRLFPQAILWVVVMEMGYGMLLLKGMIPLGILGLFYYSGTEAFFQKGYVVKYFSSLFKDKKYFESNFEEVLGKKVLRKDVFISNSLGQLTNPSKEELEDIRKELDND
jgi:hypothetical protein